MSDDEIVSMIAEGSIAAFEQLYTFSYKKVFVFILSIVKCRQTAEDLMHDTFMRVFDKASSYHSGTSVNTWIMTIAKNISYDYLRKVKPVLLFDEYTTENDQICQHDTYDHIIEHFELEMALAQVPELNAQIVVLYAVCGYKHREIAQILSIPEGTVRAALQENDKTIGQCDGRCNR